MLTVERLNQVIHYDPISGNAYRKLNNRDQGSRLKSLECIGNHGYIVVQIDKRKYLLHRLIFFLEDGEFPEEVGHINRDRIDNRRINLRKCSRRENANNCGPSKYSTSGFKGISWNSQSLKWRVQLNGKYLGSFTTLTEAKEVVNNYKGK